MLNRLREFDFYRKIPKDLTESTPHGSVLSICAAAFMTILFVAELWAFMSMSVETTIIIDPNPNALLRINFNITVTDLPCEFAVIDVVDVLGTREDNVTKNVNFWQVDSSGYRRSYEGVNIEQKDLKIDLHHPALEELHKNGISAFHLDTESFMPHLAKNELTFVNFYAPWCIWCQRLEPVWEAFAEKAEELELPISIVKVDCVANAPLCMQYKIQAFPSLKIFKKGEYQSPDYRNDRTVDALIQFLDERLALHAKVKNMDPGELALHKETVEASRDDHPACMMAGWLLVNKVPGNFHIEARSKHHNLNPKTANLSHVVNHLSFGPIMTAKLSKKLDVIPDEVFRIESTHTMDGKSFEVNELHQALHHFVKVVPTQIEVGARYRGKDAIGAYQMVEASQLMKYDDEEIPEARFTYDISPMAVVISRRGKRWYEFVTSVCALIGGTFTVVGLLSGFLNMIFKPKKL